MISIDVVGLKELKSKFTLMGLEFNSAAVREVLDAPAKSLLQASKDRTVFYWEIGEDFRKDLAVQRDRKDDRSLLVGPRFRPYKIRGREEKIAVIAQHITEGFRQTDRYTKKGQRRGRVADRFTNPVSEALRDKQSQLQTLIIQGINKKVAKMKVKYGV